MRLKFKRVLSGPQLGLAIGLGVISAYYTWVPFFEELKKIEKEQKANQLKEEPATISKV